MKEKRNQWVLTPYFQKLGHQDIQISMNKTLFCGLLVSGLSLIVLLLPQDRSI